MRKGTIIAIVLNIVLLSAAGWVFFNRQYVLDQIALFRYQPSSEIQQLASVTTMTSEAERYFYASHPSLQNGDQFGNYCTSHGEQTAVLGCYNGQSIYILRVNDQRLDGVEEVTAAHEMLHAAYQRLSNDERQKIDGLLDTEAAKITDPRFTQLLEYYAKSEPGQRSNELHSIIGTEISSVSPELESYYARYFENRQSIVTLAERYQEVFTSLKDQQAAISSRMKQLSDSISQQTSTYSAAVEQLNSDIEDYNNSQNLSPDESQSQRAELESRRQDLQDQKQAINDDIASYNQLRDQLIALNGQASSLNQSINSQDATVQEIQ